MKQCSLCDRTERTHSIGVESGICNVCTQSLLYWRKRSATKLIKRQRQIESFQNRMEVLLGNVKSLKRKKA